MYSCEIDQLLKKNNFNISNEEYKDILALADEVRYVCESYCTGCMHLRNKVMVDNSRVLIAYHTDSRGGTAYTVSYAKEKKREIINVAYRL